MTAQNKQSKKGAISFLPLIACSVLIFGAAGNGEAYNISMKGISNPNDSMSPYFYTGKIDGVVDGSNLKTTGTCASADITCHTKKSNGTYGKKKNSLLLQGNKSFSSYVSGTQYTLSINTPTPGKTNGFQMSARDMHGNSVGTFKKGKNSQTYNGTDGASTVGIIENVHQKNSVSSWTFNWTAPAKGTGKVVFYYGLVASDAKGDAISTNDTAYYGSVTVSEQ